MWESIKKRAIKHLSGRRGEVWLGLFSFTESIIMPLPTDTFMMLVLMIKDNAKRWFYYATITMVTSVIGAIVGYLLAFTLFDSFGPQLISFYGLEDEFIRTQAFLEDSVFLFTFIGAVSPIPYKIFVLSAGFMKVNFFTFLIASIVGRSFRLYISAWLVYKFGKQSIDLVKKYTLHITGLALVLLVAYALTRLLF